LELKYQFDKEKQANALEQEKKDAVQAEEMQRQKLMRNAFIIGFIVVCVFVFIIYRFYLQTKRVNRKLTDRNAVISKQKAEKELLLKEIHHRVKNNLQIITSLLDLQSVGIKNQETKATLLDAQSRLKSIALIHQVLSQNEQDVNVSFREFVIQLSDHIQFSMRDDKPITVHVNIPDNIQFNIETTLPLGLILNELLTNAFKYAFTDKPSGIILINILSENGKEYKLEVIDNGTSIPDSFDIKNSKSLGLRLVRTLCKQLSGKMNFEFTDGAHFSLLFLEASK
nr:hypothetical protein [Bacteroidota bacterium]